MLLSAGGVALQTKAVGVWTNKACAGQGAGPSLKCGGAADEDEALCHYRQQQTPPP